MTKKKSIAVKKKETELIKSISIEQARLIAKDSIKAGIDHNIALKELAEKNLPEYFKTKKQTDEMSNNIEKVSLALSLETGHILAESVPTRYRPFALQLKSDLEKEFDCKTASEIALVDQAVNAHIRKCPIPNLWKDTRSQSG